MAAKALYLELRGENYQKNDKSEALPLTAKKIYGKILK